MLKRFLISIVCYLGIFSNSANAASVLPPGGILTNWQTITSTNGQYYLVHQADGNAVFYRNRGPTARWNSQSPYNPNGYTIMQTDGNLVVYDNANIPLWHSSTGGNPNSYLVAQDDGNMVIYNSSNIPIWSIGSDPLVNDPSSIGDVVGRDLIAIDPFAPLGHMGIFDGGRIAQAAPNVNGNAIYFTGVYTFRTAAPYWGAVSPRLPSFDVNFCPNLYCRRLNTQDYSTFGNFSVKKAIAARAYQANLIGADYTYSGYFTSARPGLQQSIISTPPRRGIYRCDTFVVDMLNVSVEGEPQRAPSSWQNRMSDLYNMPKSPSLVFNKILGFN